MKVRELITALADMNQEAEICALVYGKELFVYDDDDEVVLTDESWSRVVAEFQADRGIVNNLYDWIAEAVSEYAEQRPA